MAKNRTVLRGHSLDELSDFRGQTTGSVDNGTASGSDGSPSGLAFSFKEWFKQWPEWLATLGQYFRERNWTPLLTYLLFWLIAVELAREVMP